MRKRTLRALLGAGYVCLLTALLLYQADVFGQRRDWTVAVSGTLVLGVALAVVLALYLRAGDRIVESEEKPGAGEDGQGQDKETKAAVPESDRKQSESAGAGGMPGNAFAAEVSQPAPRSYEEIYALFLTTMETCALSERELEVAWFLYRGYTNRQIGEELYIAETTVKKHVSHIYQKMDVCSRKEFRAMVQRGAWERSGPGG